MQSWRGMIELGNLMQDFPSTAWGANATLAAELLTEAARFKVDIDSAVRHSVVRDNQTGTVAFVPAAVTPGKNNATPYVDMTADTVASYSNFRYYAGAPLHYRSHQLSSTLPGQNSSLHVPLGAKFAIILFQKCYLLESWITRQRQL